MKRLCSILLVAVLIVTSFATVAFATEGSATASVSSSQHVHAGDVVTLTVTVSGKFSNYELTLSADSGLTITAITGVTSNVDNGKVAFSSSVNNGSHSFNVTVKVADDAKVGSYNVYATMTKASMIVDVAEDIEDGIPDGLVRVDLGNGSCTLTVDCEHVWGEWKTIKEANCKEEGKMIRTCTKCGEEETKVIAKTEHVWGEWKTTKEANCKEEGKMVRTCTKCGEEETKVIAKTEHDWSEWKETKPATCTENGEKTRTCSICGEEQTETIPAGHKWGEWKVTKKATCAEAGEETRTCSVCGEKETRTIAKLPHTFNECDGEWKKDATNHWHECSVCGERCEHDAEHVARTYWELSEDGKVEQLLCEICGYVMDEKPVVKPVDPEPGTGDITGQVAFGGMAIVAVLAALAYVVMKRKAIK